MGLFEELFFKVISWILKLLGQFLQDWGGRRDLFHYPEGKHPLLSLFFTTCLLPPLAHTTPEVAAFYLCCLYALQDLCSPCPAPV